MTDYTPFFMVYGSETVLPTDLDYTALRVRAYDEQGAKASLEDAMDQLDEACNIALLRSARYQQALRRYHNRRVWGQAFNVGTWCSASSRATRTATSSLRRGRDHTSSRRCSDQAPTSSRSLMTKSSSTPRTLNSYVTFTPSLYIYLRKLRMMFLK